MRTVLLNITTSLDGFIADANGGIDWLMPPPSEVPADYTALMDTVDTLVMGRATYETSLAIEGGLAIFEGKRVYVVTSRDNLPTAARVALVHEEPVAFVSRLKAEPGGTIWLFGGGRLATALSDAGLVDEYLIAIQPILLGDGIPLWRSPHGMTRLKNGRAQVWDGGLVVVRYSRDSALWTALSRGMLAPRSRFAGPSGSRAGRHFDMAEESMSDVEMVRVLSGEDSARLSPEQRAAINGVLARLEAAEKACRMVADSLSPKARAAAVRKTYWFDVAIAIKQWQDLAEQ